MNIGIETEEVELKKTTGILSGLGGRRSGKWAVHR